MALSLNITIVILICGCVTAYFVFKLLNNSARYKEKKSDLLLKYQKLRKKSLQLQEGLSIYILSGDYLKEPFVDGMTYGNYLKYLQKNHIQHLSDKGYLKIKKSDNRLQQKKVYEMLNHQEIILGEAEEKLDFLWRKIKALP